MVRCLFDRATGRFVGGTRYGELVWDNTTHVLLSLPDFPADPNVVRWDGNLGTRPATQAELDADLVARRDADAQRMDLWLRAALREIARLPAVGLQPQVLIDQVRTEYRRLLDVQT